jgi:putative oxygen-independent coproporphyrinogen III oxidase
MANDCEGTAGGEPAQVSASIAPVTSEPGFGIYVHWPFCAQKCPYCDFNSHVRHDGWDEARFLAAYRREIAHNASLLGNSGTRSVSSIFFGGGTPSLMEPATVGAILDEIALYWPIEPAAEVTLEANPGSVEAGRFAGYRRAGVNRVSIGVQSLRDDELKRLGRIHTVDEAKEAVAIAQRTFDRFSLDLIYARPRQTPEAWRTELGEALSLAGRHLSLYQLTIEPDTTFARLHAAGKLQIPDSDDARALYDLTHELTTRAGLAAYEISNHALPGEESRHNLLYWRYGEYVGVGPGAHGRICLDGGRRATATECSPEKWVTLVESQGHGYVEAADLTPAEEADEMLLMGLRLTEGIDLDRLSALSGLKPAKSVVANLAREGLVELMSTDPGFETTQFLDSHPDDIRACVGPGLAPAPSTRQSRLRATAEGRLVLNEVIAKLAIGLEPAASASKSAHQGDPAGARP